MNSLTNPRRARTDFVGCRACETLEARCLLSVSAAGVGAYFDGSYLTPYSLEVTLDESGAFGGSVRSATTHGAGSSYSPAVDSISFLDDGRYVPHFRSTFEPYQSVNGAVFTNGTAHPAGWFAGLDPGYSRAEFAVVTERAADLTWSDLSGSWRYNSILVTTTTVLGAWGTLDISGSHAARTTSVPGRSTIYDSVTITSVTSNGAIRTSDGQYVWASNPKQLAVAADLDFADGQASISMIYRAASRSADQIAGGYRVGAVATGTLAASLSGLSAAQLDFYLQLNQDGTFSRYDLAQYDAGVRTPIASGSWSVSGENVVLVDGAGSRRWTFQTSADGVVLVPYSTAAKGGATEVLFGSALRVETSTRPVFGTVRQSDSWSAARLYSLQSDSTWRVIDLQAKAGGPAITGTVVSWTDPKDGLLYAAAQAGNSLVLYRNDVNGAWSRRDLRTITSGSKAISSNLNVMVDPTNGIVHLTGLASNGDLVRYSQTTAAPVWGNYAWSFSNIAASDLRAHGESMPAFVGSTATYATSWGGLNVAGLDALGNIWSVWWAPGASHWSAANLTSAYGADPVSGGLSVYLTSWGGINIAALDESGEIRVTWWVPQMGGTWAHSNLTAEVGGPRFTPDSVSSYVSSWGGLNIVGSNRDTGEAQVYWWSPERVSIGWAVTSFTDTLGAEAPRPTRAFQGLAGRDNSLNVFGVTSTGKFLRYFWYPGYAAWQHQSVSEIALPN